MRQENDGADLTSRFWQSTDLRKVLDNMTDAFAAIDRDFTIAHVNQKSLEISGMTYEEVVGRNHWELLPDLKGTVVESEYRKAFETGQPVHFEFYYDALVAWLQVHAYPMGDFLHVFYRDVTAAYTAVRDQENRETQLRSMVDAIPQIAWSADPQGTPTYLNRRWFEYSGLSVGDSAQRSELVHPEDRDQYSEAWRHAREKGEPYQGELRLRAKDGSYRWFLLRAIPSRDVDGNIVRWFGTGTDIHEQKMAEQELARRVEERTRELQAANKELESFTYSVSHDLRGPMRAISSCSMMLIEDYADQLPEDARELLERQSENAKKLSSLVDALLQLSRVGRAELKRTDFDLSAMATEVSSEITAKTGGAGCGVVVEPGLVANGDAQLTRLVLYNLIENACKFSPGSPEVLVGKGADGAFFVQDKGIGFEMDHAEKVFHPFERLVRDSEFPGTGIGLANVERIIRRHGGKVWAQSTPGEGSTFYFTLGPAEG